MAEWLKISLGAVFLLWLIWKAVQYFRCPTVRAIERLAKICLGAGITEYFERDFLGIREFRLIMRPDLAKFRPIQGATRPKEVVESETTAPAMETREQAVAKLLREMLVLSIPRWPKSAFSMPKYIELTVLGKREVYELVPLKATAAGKWFFTYEERPAEAETKSKNPVRVPLGFWSYIIQKQRIGTVVSKTSLLNKKKVYHVSPRSGFIVSMQIQNGIEVTAGDVVCILACQTELILPAAEIESSSPTEEAS